MNPLLILLIGMAVVIGGILALRLHAFLALVAGALVVALLTPTAFVYHYALRSGALDVAGFDADAQTVTLRIRSPLPEGMPLLLLQPDASSTGYRQLATLRVISSSSGQATLQITSPQPLASLTGGEIAIEPPAEAAARRSARQPVGARLGEGFGRTAIDIGILIAMAAIIGETLLISGGAERIVASSRRLLGDNRAALAFLVSGFILGIPVFFDTVFYLLIPLVKIMRLRTGRNYTLYVLATVAGATMTHSLVPPTPGPLFVAAQLNVSIATMIVGGLIVGAITAAAGYAYALYANRRWNIPLRPDAVPRDLAATPVEPDEATLPPLWLALAPILLPVLFISAAAIAGSTGGLPDWLLAILATIGEKNLALTIAAAVGLLMVVRARHRNAAPGKTVAAATGEALASAGVIILITSAGGAFGHVLRQTDIAHTIQDLLPPSRLALIPLAFFVAAAVRTAQGSATVAMITAAGIVSPIAAAGSLGFHPLYLALAIGAGSKPVMWMNDSGFWIIGRMSGFTESETLKTATIMMAIMGLTGLLVTLLGAWLLPLV